MSSGQMLGNMLCPWTCMRRRPKFRKTSAGRAMASADRMADEMLGLSICDSFVYPKSHLHGPIPSTTLAASASDACNCPYSGGLLRVRSPSVQNRCSPCDQETRFAGQPHNQHHPCEKSIYLKQNGFLASFRKSYLPFVISRWRWIAARPFIQHVRGISCLERL